MQSGKSENERRSAFTPCGPFLDRHDPVARAYAWIDLNGVTGHNLWEQRDHGKLMFGPSSIAVRLQPPMGKFVLELSIPGRAPSAPHLLPLRPVNSGLREGASLGKDWDLQVLVILGELHLNCTQFICKLALSPCDSRNGRRNGSVGTNARTTHT